MTKITIPREALEAFCGKWKIRTLELFGSALRDDFSKKSDIDIMVSFLPGEVPGFAFIDMKEELEKLFGRPVDVVTRKAIENSPNPNRKQAILSSTQVLYEKEAA